MNRESNEGREEEGGEEEAMDSGEEESKRPGSGKAAALPAEGNGCWFPTEPAGEAQKKVRVLGREGGEARNGGHRVETSLPFRCWRSDTCPLGWGLGLLRRIRTEEALDFTQPILKARLKTKTK